MVFHSYSFILLFLPLIILGFYLSGRIGGSRAKELFLLAAAVIFYGQGGQKLDLFLLAASLFINFGLIRTILFLPKGRSVLGIPGRKLLLFIGIAGNLSVLLFFKYFNFFLWNLNRILGTDQMARNIPLPAGISFITFCQIAFLVDAYREEVDSCKILDYFSYASFFPHLLSGPIITGKQAGTFWGDIRKKGVDWNRFAEGLFLFGTGLGKKVLLADTLGRSVNWGYANIEGLNTLSAWVVCLCYSLQVYFDFSAYSDMAIGVSRLLGLDLPVNFDSPYRAKTLPEFWRRWHITLTQFFTKYLYIPLGGNRRGRIRTWINIMIVFLCSGLWHGASWTYVFWGGLHGLFMILSRECESVIRKIPAWINWMMTFLFINLAWVFFRADSFDMAARMLHKMFSITPGFLPSDLTERLQIPCLHRLFSYVIPDGISAVILVAGILTVALWNKNSLTLLKNRRWGMGMTLVFLASVFLSMLSFTGENTFLYFNY